MKKLFKPFVKMASSYYEGTTLTKVPRSRSRKVRKYINIDIQKEFERKDQNYKDMQKDLLERVYELHGEQIRAPDGSFKKDMINVNAGVDLVEIGDPADLKSKLIVSGVK